MVTLGRWALITSVMPLTRASSRGRPGMSLPITISPFASAGIFLMSSVATAARAAPRREDRGCRGGDGGPERGGAAGTAPGRPVRNRLFHVLSSSFRCCRGCWAVGLPKRGGCAASARGSRRPPAADHAVQGDGAEDHGARGELAPVDRDAAVDEAVRGDARQDGAAHVAPDRRPAAT